MRNGEISEMLPNLPSQPVVYDLVTRLVQTIREPYRSEVKSLCPGQALRLYRDAGNPSGSHVISVVSQEGRAAGNLSADVTSYLSILLDHDRDIIDESFAESILLAAPPDDPAARRLRYPKLFLHMQLKLSSGWPFFVIAAVLGLKTEDFADRFNLAGNPWLTPLWELHAEYQRLGHDRFRLPPEIAETWMQLTRQSTFQAELSLTKPGGDDKITR
jgi:hypothetical protein